MTDEQLRQRLLNGCVLAVDTSAFYGQELFAMANRINALRDARGTTNKLVLGAIPFTERLAQERRRREDSFELQVVTDFLRSKGIEVAEFGAQDAVGGSAWLQRVAPTSDAWMEAKYERIAKELGLEGGTPRRVSTTIDWFIAAHASSREWTLIIRDKGPEFANLSTAVRKARFDAVVDQLLSA